jgi:hypothetical protein
VRGSKSVAASRPTLPEREIMSVAALIAWVITAFGGLYLLTIWLIEYDVSAPGGAISRLPRTVITGHVLLATSGLVVWIIYLIEDRDILAWIALSTLSVVALLGLTMLGRWIVVRRALTAAVRASTTEELEATRASTPAEGLFPVPIVLGHGLLAGTTLTLVLLTVLGVGGS